MTDQTLTDDEVAVAAEAGEEATETEVVDETDAAEDDAADDEAKPSSSADVLENEGEIAADYLEELLDIADLDGDIDTYVEGGRAGSCSTSRATGIVAARSCKGSPATRSPR